MNGEDIGAIVARLADASPEHVALIAGERQQTWRELQLAMDGVAAHLSTRLPAAARVAMLATNSIEYVQAFFGVLRAGMCAVPLPTLASAEALSLMLTDCSAAALFACADYRELAERIAGPSVSRVGLDFSGGAWADHAAWCSPVTDWKPPPIAAGDAFDIMYSSGTTGVPKGIVHTHAARRASYAGSRARHFSPETVNVVATPFYSNTTCVTWFLTTAAGGVNVLVPRFSTDALFDAVERHHVTHAMLVPVQYARLLDAERWARADLSSVKYLFSTSAPLRAETKRKLLDDTRAEVIEIYGLTEGGPVTVLEARKHPDKLASVGMPAPGCDIRIVDEAGRELPCGATGEVIGRSANMMSGYLNRPEETAAAFHRSADGTLFLRTGDLGRFDDAGFLYLLDRKKDVIISGGFNVYATDLEAVLLRHPDVAEACVFGIPSERWGETPLGLVVLRAGRSVTAEALRDFCNERVGKVQRLHAVGLRSELPKNAIGKILKRELRAPFWAKAH